MSKVFIISATPDAGFWRCGRHWTKAGVPVAKDDLTEAEWQRIENEPMLRVKPAKAEDTAALEERAEQIAEAIAALSEDDFQKDGKPKVDAINALVAEDLGSKVTAAERDAVWAKMTENGFEAPAASS